MTINRNSRSFAHFLAAFIVCIWGVTFVNTKCLIRAGLGVNEIFLLRFSIAYVCITLWSVFKGKFRLWADSLKDEIYFVLLGISGGSLYFSTENMAVGHTMVNNVSFIICTAPVMTIFLARVFTRSVTITKRLLCGTFIALLGVAIVIFNGHFVLQLNPLGDFLALTAAFCWAIYSLLIKKVSGRYSSLFLTRKVFIYGVLTILPVFIFQGWQFPLSGFSQPIVWANLLFLGFVASFLCFLLWSWVISRIGALKTSNYIYLNPVTTVVASAVVLDEPMTFLSVVGSLLILIGVYLANSRRIES